MSGHDPRDASPIDADLGGEAPCMAHLVDLGLDVRTADVGTVHPRHGAELRIGAERPLGQRSEGADMELTLTAEQHTLLREVLDQAYRDLRYEIADTDDTNFKQGLRDRADLLSSILDAVGGPLPDRS